MATQAPPASSSALYPSLRDKVVIITGGAEGIGAAAVEGFCRQNARVAVFDISKPSFDALVQHIRGLEAPYEAFPISIPEFYHVDVTDLARLKEAAEEVVREYGGVDVLVNNAAAAGGTARKATMDVSPEAWEGNLNVNLRHVFFLTQYIAHSMKERGGGAIINMGSISWRIPAVGTPVYMAAKAAIMGLTKTHSKEFAAWSIRVNSILPGAIATERQNTEVYGPDPAYHDYCLANQTIKRDLLPREVGAVMVFLASGDASAITGSSYVVDGGWVSDV